MSSVSPASEFFSDLSDSVPSDTAEPQSAIPAYLRRSLNMLDLQPEAELAKYRAYQEDKSNPPIDQQFSPVLTTPEEEEEDYEEIPPSEPFAVIEHNARAYASDVAAHSVTEPPGELVFREAEPPAANLDLSLLPPGEISSARNEYLPASQELWRSLGKPTAITAAIPKWKLPVAIGSSLAAVAAVTGMTYVNLHPVLLQQVPTIAQLTAPPVMPAIPPGQNLQGPDLAMGEFSDLSLGNINSISLPGSATPIAQNPIAGGGSTVQSPVVANSVTPPSAPLNATTPNFTTAAPPAQPSPGNRLSDTLIRNLLPPNIQQMAEQSVSQQPIEPQAPIVPGIQATVKPYVPQAPTNERNSLKKNSDNNGSVAAYQVRTKYINPIGFERIHSILPEAKRSGDQIVLGSFTDKSAAANLVKKLKRQGVEAWFKQG